ncbi:hypothetical protein D8674_014354 [Pyrus ussuriensis x Pyrus communis]|uniref:Uncharacterized protein n=1 Tax=Pyrus ussuriensis x Pyrus communis TaxID=2448454 RepID=A0A5N5GSB6_9ROSA|nr:hypothetical protein D8674_014354 [Pyrus ussuriensis x Pyrus communis]
MLSRLHTVPILINVFHGRIHASLTLFADLTRRRPITLSHLHNSYTLHSLLLTRKTLRTPFFPPAAAPLPAPPFPFSPSISAPHRRRLPDEPAVLHCAGFGRLGPGHLGGGENEEF